MIWVRTLTLVFAIGVLQAADPVTPVNQNGQGIAVKGTDVVAYFTGGSPKTGQAGLSHRWMGATWLFSSRENLDAFRANPEKYAPQYGGYCAYAVSTGKTANISPEAWKIVDGRLYLNHPWAKGKWERDVPGAITKADHQWPKIAKKPVQ